MKKDKEVVFTRNKKIIKKEEFIAQDDDLFLKEDIIDDESPKPIKKSPLKLAKHKKKKRKLKKWVFLVIILFVLIIGGLTTYFIIHKHNVEKEKMLIEEKIKDIKSHYNKYVIVNAKTNLYQKKDNEYEVIGSLYKDLKLELSDITIDQNVKYFNILDTDYYLEYQKVDKIDQLDEYEQRYKNYLPFNKNVSLKDGFVLYNGDKEVISFNKGMEFPIIINDYDNRYYIEYENRLLSVKKEDVKEIIDAKNTDKKNRSYITTLAYHRVYDTDEKCNDPYICMKKSFFDQQMKYLSENNYFTLNMGEMYMYLKGNIQIEKGVTITFDDGYLYKSAEDVLAKYNLNGTMFVISRYFSDIKPFKELKHIDIQSHTHDMHRNYVCPLPTSYSQGGAILCASEKAIKEDLETSLEKLDIEPWGLAFPFYDYNDKAIKVLKDVGFKMSFIGVANTNGKAYPKKTDLYKIPRMTIWDQSLTTFNEWKSCL